jgi:hypothetical protein
MNGLRKAALYLHGLDEADRRWLLDALEDGERDRLLATLNELDEMGVPRGDPWLPELAEAHATDGQVTKRGNGGSDIEAIDKADLSGITQAFDGEPDRVVAMLLKHRVWSWRQAYVGKQYLQKRERLLHALETPDRPLKSKTEAALISALAAKLNSLGSVVHDGFETALATEQRNNRAGSRKSPWRRLWQR